MRSIDHARRIASRRAGARAGARPARARRRSRLGFACDCGPIRSRIVWITWSPRNAAG